jgi:hypothetical protein
MAKATNKTTKKTPARKPPRAGAANAKTATTKTATTARNRSVRKTRVLAAPTDDQIRERAFQIYLARNGAPGDPTSDWLEAERQLTQEARR